MNVITVVIEDDGQIGEVLSTQPPPLVLVLDKRLRSHAAPIPLSLGDVDPLGLLAALPRQDAEACEQLAQEAVGQVINQMHALRLSHAQRQQLVRIARMLGAGSADAAESKGVASGG